MKELIDKIIFCDKVIMVDVDDTLVMHEQEEPTADIVYVKDILDDTRKVKLRANTNMIRLVKEESTRGSAIVVWSRGGYNWAANVIEALELEDYVTMIMSKPLAYFDDKPASEWLTDRVYIGPDNAYKKHIV